jgi:hypothetical protein
VRPAYAPCLLPMLTPKQPWASPWASERTEWPHVIYNIRPFLGMIDFANTS